MDSDKSASTTPIMPKSFADWQQKQNAIAEQQQRRRLGGIGDLWQDLTVSEIRLLEIQESFILEQLEDVPITCPSPRHPSKFAEYWDKALARLYVTLTPDEPCHVDGVPIWSNIFTGTASSAEFQTFLDLLFAHLVQETALAPRDVQDDSQLGFWQWATKFAELEDHSPVVPKDLEVVLAEFLFREVDKSSVLQDVADKLNAYQCRKWNWRSILDLRQNA